MTTNDPGRAVQNCIARIIDKNGSECGAAVLVSQNHVVTCAHVIGEALDVDPARKTKPTATVSLRFPFSSSRQVFTGRIISWARKVDNPELEQARDTAVIRLDQVAPSDLQPTHFLLANEQTGHAFFAWGAHSQVPAGDGVDGKIKMVLRDGSLQIECTSESQTRITPGFSGGPVWDSDSHGLIGILSQDEDRDRLAYAITTALLRKAWRALPTIQLSPEINEHIELMSSQLAAAESPYRARAHDFNLSVIKDEDNVLVPLGEILPILQGLASRRALLYGPAGIGKTTAVGKIVRSLLGQSTVVVPVVVNLKDWANTDEFAEKLSAWKAPPDDIDKWIDYLLQNSLTPNLSYRSLIQTFCSKADVLLIADAVNEVGSEAARLRIDEMLFYFARDPPTTSHRIYVLVTDRDEHDFKLRGWARLALQPLTIENARACISEALNEDENELFSRIGDQELDVLRLPYYAEIAIKNKKVVVGSESGINRSFFQDGLRLSDDVLDRIAISAFKAYCDARSPTFHLEPFRSSCGENVTRLLRSAAVLRAVGEDKAQFSHQIQHDYMVARHMSRCGADGKPLAQGTWNRRTYDAITLDSASFHILRMTLEQLEDPEKGDLFLERVYDWNWRAAVACLMDDSLGSSRFCSREMKTAIIALVSQKRLDPVEHTRSRASRELRRLGLHDKALLEGSLDEMIAFIKRMKTKQTWFKRWKLLFARQPADGPPDEGDIRLITDGHSVIGWGASNVLKRFRKLPDGAMRQLRAYYDSALQLGENGEAIRWRVVHCLGSFPTLENVELLQRAFQSDQYEWAQYGAARSLIECAARTRSTVLRERILSHMRSHVPKCGERIRDEIGRAVLFAGAPSSWITDASPILVKCRSIETGERRKEWDARINRFRKGEWQSATSMRNSLVGDG